MVDRGNARTASEARGSARFEAFSLDHDARQLRQNGALVALSALSYRLLACLVHAAGRVVTRDALTAELWPGIKVTDGSLRQVIWEVRQALGDTAESPRYIQTVRGNGYRFLPAVVAQAPECLLQARATATFIGRDADLAQLSSAYAASRAEGGRACVLVAAPGMGKSRLARELIHVLDAEGPYDDDARPSLLEGHTDPDGMAPAFWPFMQLIGEHLARVDDTQRGHYAQLAPLAFRMLTDHEGDASSDALWGSSATQQRFQLLAQLGRLFVAMANHSPGVILLEDVHWADEASLAFLAQLGTLLAKTRSLLVITCRTVSAQQNRPLARALQSLARGPLNTRIELLCLSGQQVRELLELHAPEVPRALCEDAHALGGGNPLATLELARLWGSAAVREAAPLLSELVEARTIISRRVAGLDLAAREVVLAASVLGTEFTLGELMQLLPDASDSTLAQLDACIASGFIVEHSGRGRYQFAHPLMREVAYAALPRAQRGRLHRVAGEYIEARNEDARLMRLHELAHHFFVAAAEGGAHKAAVYAARCGERAYAATAYRDAVAHYDRALACAEMSSESDATFVLELSLARGEAQRAAGFDTAHVNQLFLDLAQRAQQLDKMELFGRAILGHTGQRSARFTPTHFPSALGSKQIALIERALTALGPQPSELRALLLCSLIYALAYSPDHTRREQFSEEALAVATALDIPALTARVLIMQVYACAGPHNQAQRLERCHQLIALSEAHALLEQELDGRIARAMCRLGEADVLTARGDIERAASLAASIGTPRARARANLPDLLQAFAAGDLDEALRLSQATHDASSEDLAERALLVVRMASVHTLRCGTAGQGRPLQEMLFNTCPDAIGFRCVLASAYASEGDSTAALEHFDWIARDDFRHLPEDINWLAEMGFLADAVVQLGDVTRARSVFERLAPYRDRVAYFIGEAAPAGPIAHWLAELSTTMGHFREARKFIEQARTINERMGASLFMQYTHLAEARLLFESRPDERPRAMGLLRDICTYADTRGCQWLRRCAEQLADRYGVGHTSLSRLPDVPRAVYASA